MSHPIGSYSFTIDAYLSDFRGKATLPMMMGFMLQAATKHAEERGFGYTAMTVQNKAWVLTRMKIFIQVYPSNENEIYIHTWAADINKLFSERCFSFQDKAGNPLGFARSLWAAIDVDSRKATNILDLEGLKQFIHRKECPIAPPQKLSDSKVKGHLADSFQVKYSDIDINKHLSSLKYIEHFVDIFPIEMYQEKEIREFDINYIQEGHYGEKLEIEESELGVDEYMLGLKESDKTICLAKVRWEPFVK